MFPTCDGRLLGLVASRYTSFVLWRSYDPFLPRQEVQELLDRKFSRKFQAIEKAARVRLLFWMLQPHFGICICQVSTWKPSREIAKVSTVFGSTISSGSVSSGGMGTPTTSRSSIITRRH